MSTTTLHTTESGRTISVVPTELWKPLPIEGEIPQPYKTPNFGLEVVPLHPTFACELRGVDWSKPIPPEVYAEIRAVCDKVRRRAGSPLSRNRADACPQYGVVACRNTGLSDAAHVDFSRYFGDLDDVRPYIEAGRKHRLPSPELFDAGNIDPDTGDVAPLSAAQVIGNKV